MLPTPAPGFDQPLALLRACHDRIRQQCDTLEELIRHVQAEGLDAPARQACRDVLRYFTTAGRHHHEDEEQDLFPLLRGDPAAVALLARLESEHRRMEKAWSRLQPLLETADRLREPEDWAPVAREFIALNRAHVDLENRELLPRAEQLLPEPVLAVIGARMARRRGITL